MESAIGFIICAVIIFFAGKKLSYYGDLLADLTGMGKVVIGLILMSVVTSLPELMVGISSVVFLQSADLALGDILGSCAFNLGILSLMDVFTPRDSPLFSKVSRSQILAAAFGVLLIALVGIGLFLDVDIVITPFIGLTSISFVIVYLVGIKTIFNFQRQKLGDVAVESHSIPAGITLKKVIGWYALFALIIIGAALALPHFAEDIAEATGLGKSFVGTFFLAASTSLPEIAVSYAAIRLGSTDMAVGNLLGSNLFNVVILFLDDLFYTNGHLLKDASEINLLSVFFVILMSGVAVIGIIFPGKQKKIFMSWDTLAIFSLYVINMLLLFLLSS
jgi:cation:H+ antiporter